MTVANQAADLTRAVPGVSATVYRQIAQSLVLGPREDGQFHDYLANGKLLALSSSASPSSSSALARWVQGGCSSVRNWPAPRDEEELASA